MPGIQLKEHQVDQKAAFRKWVGFPARSSVPPEGARGTIVSATGSGKTITAAACALECFPGARILVTVPTLDLLVQTAQAWRLVGHRAPMVAVCSLENDPVLNELDVRTTTNPIQLALWAGSGPVVVFATYASLVDREDIDAPEGQRKVRGPLEAALAGGERLYGQQMAGFDLAIIDEAHGTAGDLGRPWAAIHDNQRIPADFRLYLTATPRILASPRPQKGADGQELVLASMGQDSETYGPWLAELGLSEAIERGILAGFEIDVLEIRDPSLVFGESEEGAAGPAHGAVADGAAGARREVEPAHRDDVPPTGGGGRRVRGEAARDRCRAVRQRRLRRGPGEGGGPAEVIDPRGVLRAGGRPPRTPGPRVGGVAVRRPPRVRAA
ncbi:putative helicase [Streptomyces albogriseolus]